MAETKTTKSGFSAEERAAIKQRAQELKASVLREDGAKALAEAVEKLDGLDRKLAENVVALVEAAAPKLNPKTYYGFPAWAKDGKVVLFFKPASKFNTRYAKIEFDDAAAIDDGTMFPCSYGLLDVTDANSKAITALVKKALR
jgi:uncharacterized protein YdhG (YjbR/CyaY superfamily)